MKTLPDNPNLDHLRRQAKDLLAGLRDSRPGVSLAEAQTSLANQYGFRTWPDLKAEVDRQRGQADIADAALAQAVATRYGLGQVTAPMRSVARTDHVGRPWSLETDRGRWAVSTLGNWWPIVDVETEVALREAAAREGILLPVPVRSRSGAIVESIGGHDWRVSAWLPAGPPLSAPVSAATADAVGRILAKIHRLALPVDRVSPWHAQRLSTVTWPELAASAEAAGAGWASLLAEAVPTLEALESVGEDEPVPPPVLCHNSLNPGNARLGADGRLIVLGWEHAGGQPPSWELSNALLYWVINPDGTVNTAAARAMVDGYRWEAGWLPPLGMATFRGAATGLSNYVAGQVEEALNARDAEDRRYANRSVRHLLSPPPSRAHLERLLAAISSRVHA